MSYIIKYFIFKIYLKIKLENEELTECSKLIENFLWNNHSEDCYKNVRSVVKISKEYASESQIIGIKSEVEEECIVIHVIFHQYLWTTRFLVSNALKKRVVRR
jgi:hypothetical protein